MPDHVLETLSIEQQANRWRRNLTEANMRTVIVIERDHRVVGFCRFGASRDDDAKDNTVGEIIALNIHPDHWRCGFGTQLCENVLRDAPRRGWDSLTLWVIEDNVVARRFYEKLGFTPDGFARTNSQLIGAPLHEVRYRHRPMRVHSSFHSSGR